jgi:hypothetical protein
MPEDEGQRVRGGVVHRDRLDEEVADLQRYRRGNPEYLHVVRQQSLAKEKG